MRFNNLRQPFPQNMFCLFFHYYSSAQKGHYYSFCEPNRVIRAFVKHIGILIIYLKFLIKFVSGLNILYGLSDTLMLRQTSWVT